MSEEHVLSSIITEAVTRDHPRLRFLSEAFVCTDRMISIELEKLRINCGKTPACRPGCSVCCLKPDLPVNQLEIEAISWYTSEVLAGGVKATIRDQLVAMGEDARCPFLVGDRCAVYPLRPLSCRNFFVLGRPCAPGEDPWFTRRTDIWRCTEGWKRTAAKMLQGLGYGSFQECRRMATDGELGKVSRSMHELDLSLLVPAMDAFGRYDTA